MTDGSAAVLDVSIAGVGAELDAQATAMQSDERTLSEIRADAAHAEVSSATRAPAAKDTTVGFELPAAECHVLDTRGLALPLRG
jgi:hypothetical protein